MPTHAGDNGRSVGTAVKDVADHAKRVINLELELAKIELTGKVASLGVGIGLAVGAALFGLFGFGFGWAAVAAGFATFLPTWLALLIVMGILFLIGGVLGILARAKIKRGTPPVPEQAIQEAKLTTEAIKSDA
jgi:tetrahydromethanopterin S-methyltransferase subunit C